MDCDLKLYTRTFDVTLSEEEERERMERDITRKDRNHKVVHVIS